MSLTQSKPNSTQQFNIYNTHLQCMKIQLKCKCNVMHDDLKSFKQKPDPKFSQKLQNFEKPQSLSKNPKVRLEIMKCMVI